MEEIKSQERIEEWYYQHQDEYPMLSTLVVPVNAEGSVDVSYPHLADLLIQAGYFQEGAPSGGEPDPQES